MRHLTKRNYKYVFGDGSKHSISQYVHYFLCIKLKLLWYCPYCNRYHFRNKLGFDIDGSIYGIDKNNPMPVSCVCWAGYQYYSNVYLYLKNLIDFKEMENKEYENC